MELVISTEDEGIDEKAIQSILYLLKQDKVSDVYNMSKETWIFGAISTYNKSENVPFDDSRPEPGLTFEEIHRVVESHEMSPYEDSNDDRERDEITSILSRLEEDSVIERRKNRYHLDSDTII